MELLFLKAEAAVWWEVMQQGQAAVENSLGQSSALLWGGWWILRGLQQQSHVMLGLEKQARSNSVPE